jgi:hypothetical protein
MFGSSILEVAIGVIFIYLLFSLVSSALNEYISSLLNKRGAELFEGIKNLLNDPNFTGLAQKLYNHGLVDGISQAPKDPNKPNRRPSYIASETFALALLDILSSQSAAQSWKEIAERKKIEVAAAQARVRASPADPRLQKIFFDARSALEQAEALVTKVDAVQQAYEEAEWAAGRVSGPGDIPNLRTAKEKLEKALTIGRFLAAQLPEPLENIQRSVSSLPDGHTKQSLLVLINRTKQAVDLANEADAARQEIEKLQGNIEQWFNDAMDRVSGWYKRWTQKVLLGLAMILVLVGNVDTFMLVKRLSQDQVLRAAIVSAAERVAQSSPETLEKDIFAEADKMRLPIGWTLDPADPFYGQQIPTCPADRPSACYVGWALKVAGLLISIIAIQVGAPFWFDTLSKFINIRGAGVPPGETAKSGPQPAKS